jgi:hypothetical protein
LGKRDVPTTPKMLSTWLSNLQITKDGDVNTETDIIKLLEEVVFSPQFPDQPIKELIKHQEISSVIDAARTLLRLANHTTFSPDIHTKLFRLKSNIECIYFGHEEEIWENENVN